jgi:hypothetical protein
MKIKHDHQSVRQASVACLRYFCLSGSDILRFKVLFVTGVKNHQGHKVHKELELQIADFAMSYCLPGSICNLKYSFVFFVIFVVILAPCSVLYPLCSMPHAGESEAVRRFTHQSIRQPLNPVSPVSFVKIGFAILA